MKVRREQFEVIAFDDPRMTYYRDPESWQKSMTGDGPVIKTAKYNDYCDIWGVKLTHLEWWSERSPTCGVAGFTIWGKDFTIQELLDLYSPTKDSKIELIKSWDFPPDAYTITLLNTGERWGESLGNDLVHAYFIIEGYSEDPHIEHHAATQEDDHYRNMFDSPSELRA